MKNRKSIFAFFAICAAMIFASCSNIVDANVSSSSEDKNTLNIEVTNYDEVVTQASKSANRASRTIIPDSFDSTGVDFYLYGTNTSGGTFGPEKVTFKGNTDAAAAGGAASKTVGTINIPANSAVWEFTLVALATGATPPTDETNLKNDAVLIGYSSMDMLNGDTAKFTLSPDGLTKEAAIAMKLYTEGWTLPTGFTAKAGIYLLTTGADAGADAAATEKVVDFSTATSKANAVDYAIASFTPGTYLFKVTFEKTNSNKKFYWSDVLVVLPGKTIDNVVGIPNIIREKPEAPTAFKAGYVEKSEDKFSGWYTTAFEWVRGSKNENNFEIEVLEFNDADTVTPPADADAGWTTAPTAGTFVTYDSKFSSAANYESGSLLSGNTKAQLRLELGKRYFARIRAVNDAGGSAWTLVDLATAPAEPTGTQKFTGNTINRYRLTYFMNGGTYYADKTTADADTAGTGGSTADIVSYHCEDSTTGTPIIKADGTPDGTPIIKKDKYTWSYWSTDATSETASRYNEPGAAPENYKGYKNLDLYAMFTTDASVAIFDKKSLEIQDGWITVDTGTLTGKTAAIEVTTQTEVKWTFTPGEVKDAEGNKIENFAYDKVNFTVTKGGTIFEAKSADEVGAATEFTMSLSNLPAGIYQVMFTAHYGTTTVSYPITAEITR